MPSPKVSNSHDRIEALNGTANRKNPSSTTDRPGGREKHSLSETNGNSRSKRSKPAASSKNGCHQRAKVHPANHEIQVVNSGSGRVEERNVCDLKEHPLQSTYFPDESEEADCELAADMKANGQLVEVDILPDGTILAGHRRVKAAKHLGWKKIKVVVHHELADDQAAAEAFFINDNYTRRQLTEFQKVRCVKRRVELAKQGKVKLPEGCDKLQKTRDKIGYLLDLSGRHAERYLRVLQTPVEVQHACDSGYLSLVEAGQVVWLSKEKQQQIAKELREQGLKNAKAIYDKHRTSKAATQRGAESIWCDLRRALKVAVDELVGNTGRLWPDQDDLTLIEEAEETLFTELKIRIAERLDDEEDDEDELDGWDTDELVQPVKIPDVAKREPVDTMSTLVGP